MLVHRYSVRRKHPGGSEAGWEWDDTYSIWRPNVTEAQVRSTNWGADDLLLTDLLNELGTEGWDMVSDVVRESTMTNNLRGWVGAQGTPITTRWIFKRAVPSQ